MGVLHFGSGGVMLLALILDIVALATPGWIYTPLSAQGLFQVYSGPIEASIDPKGNAEKVAIAFLLMGGVILLVATVASMAGGAKKEDKTLGKVGGVLALIAGIFFIIGTASYAGIYADVVDASDTVSWGYSFALAWTAASLAILSGAAGIAG